MSKSQRTKGHAFERWTAQQFRRVYPDARRDLNDTHGGSGVDLENTGTLAVQCKRYKSYAPITAIEEVQAPDKCPVLVTKADGKPAMVVLPLEWFIAMLGDVGVAYEYDPPTRREEEAPAGA